MPNNDALKYLAVVFSIALSGCASNAALIKNAQNGNAVAQYQLGFNYENGIDLPRDNQQALYWYHRAAEQGNQWAQANLDRLEPPPVIVQDQNSQEMLNNEALVKDVSVKLSKIDDFGFVLVRAPDGDTRIVKTIEWSVFGRSESGDNSLNDHLKPGVNLAVFALHDKAFNFGNGKFSYDFTLLGDGAALWRNADVSRSTKVGIRYWTAFSIEKRPDGLLAVKPASSEQYATLNPAIAQLDSTLISQKGREESSINLAIGTAVVVGGAAVLNGALNSSDSHYDSAPTTTSSRTERTTPTDSSDDSPSYSSPQEETRTADSKPAYEPASPATPVAPIDPFYGDCHNPMGC